jgi:hypothetical protein
MKSVLLVLLAAVLSQAQTTQPAAKPKPKNTGVKPQVIVVPPTPEQERAASIALVEQSLDRYKRTRAWLDQMLSKYKDEPGEDENHILGRHYAGLAEEYDKAAIPIGERLIEDRNYFYDDASPQSALDLNTMIVDAQHLTFILAGLQNEERKWLRSHAKDRVEPGVVIVLK